MKKVLLAVVIGVAAVLPALGQFQPCIAVPARPPEPFKIITATQPIVNTATGERGFRWIYADGTYKDNFPSGQYPPQPTPEPQIIDAFTQIYKLNAGSWTRITFYMPQTGRCVGEFGAYDDRSDQYKVVQDAAGRYIRVPVETKGDIEILIISDREFARIKGNISTSSYSAEYSSGRSYGGTFGVNLEKGWHHLVVYNGYSLAAKSVNLKFGGKLPDSRP